MIGQLSNIHIPVSKFVVRPFVFSLPTLPDLIPDNREVDDIIHFNVERLLDEAILRRTDIRVSNNMVRKNIPYFDIEGKIVWGATAMMLSEFREILRKI